MNAKQAELYKALNDALDALENGKLREVASALLHASHAAASAADTAEAEREATAWAFRRHLIRIEDSDCAVAVIREAVQTLPDYPADDNDACDVAFVKDRLSVVLAQIEQEDAA